jgi:hypothetical protein
MMSWLDWLRKQVTANDLERETPRPAAATASSATEDDPSDPPAPDDSNVPSELAGLDFYSAIATHQRWKNRLKDVVRGQSQEALDPAVVGRCDACALGQWLDAQQSDLRVSPELMTRLNEEHAQFHKLAAEVIRLSDQGLHQQALDALRTDAPYNRCSHRVTKLLSQIYFELSEFHKPASRP